MYSNYDDRYGCRVSEEDNDARSALQKAEAALEWRRADLMQLKHAISMFDEHGWDTPNDFVYSESGVLLRTINGCEPFFRFANARDQINFSCCSKINSRSSSVSGISESTTNLINGPFPILILLPLLFGLAICGVRAYLLPKIWNGAHKKSRRSPASRPQGKNR